MKIYNDRLHPEVVSRLKNGGIGVLRTDTLYGLVASALSYSAVERVYELRQRDARKACIVLIAEPAQLPAKPPLYAEQVIAHSWPGPVSIVLPVTGATAEWLHRGQRSLAFRVPAEPELRQLLLKTGPLIAPSANPQGKPPAATLDEARAYFGLAVDFYVDGGRVLSAAPSQLLRPLPNGRIEKLR